MTLYFVSIGSKEYKIEISNKQSKIDGKSIQAALAELGERGLYILRHGSLKRELHVQPQGNSQYAMNVNGRYALAKVEKSNGKSRRKTNKSAAGDLTAPISGIVVTVNIKPGDVVAEGDVLVVLESMKMQMLMKAPIEGVIVSVNVQPGSQLAKGDLLVKIE
jgi:glutaconyl-CoA/methylmalonyl-CoA decarboxylase subunit gamma